MKRYRLLMMGFMIGAVLVASGRRLSGQAMDQGENGGFVWHDTEGKSVELQFNGSPVLCYMYEFDPQKRDETYKPYFHVIDPQTQKALTKGPGGKYPHHRAIFIGWNKLKVGDKQYDFWHMKGTVQVHKRFVSLVASEQAELTSEVDWNLDSGDTILKETRRVVAHRPPDDRTIAVLDFSSSLKAVAGDMVLGGDPEHAGMQYRASNDVDTGPADGKAVYTFHKDGIDPRKDKDLPWVMMTYKLDGKTYHVIHINHPGNPAGTVYSAYRDYGRFGAFPTASLAKDQTLTLNYRICVLTGEKPDRNQVGAMYRQYTNETK